jgi:hypothetical protein
MDPITLLTIARTLRSVSAEKGWIYMFGLKNTLSLIGMAVVGFAVGGWYLGWYGISTTADSQGHSHFSMDVNVNQIEQDIKKGEDKVKDIVNSHNAGVVPVPPPSIAAPGAPYAPTAPSSSGSGFGYSVPPQSGPTFTQGPDPRAPQMPATQAPQWQMPQPQSTPQVQSPTSWPAPQPQSQPSWQMPQPQTMPQPQSTPTWQPPQPQPLPSWQLPPLPNVPQIEVPKPPQMPENWQNPKN